MWVEIGLQLKQAREAHGLSFDELQDKTRVPKSYLQALEKGEFNKLPSPFYCRSYLRAFAEQVGLEPTTLLRKYRLSSTGQTAAVSQVSDSSNADRKVQNSESTQQMTGRLPQVGHPQTTGYVPQGSGRTQQATGHLRQVTGRVQQATGYLPQVTGHAPQVTHSTMQMPALIGRAVHDEGQAGTESGRTERHSDRHQKLEADGRAMPSSYTTRDSQRDPYKTRRLPALPQQTGASTSGRFETKKLLPVKSVNEETQSTMDPLPTRSSRGKGELKTALHSSWSSRKEVAATQEQEQSTGERNFSLENSLENEMSLQTGSLSRRNSSRNRRVVTGEKKGIIPKKILPWVAAAAVIIPVGVWGGSALLGDESSSKTKESQQAKVDKADDVSDKKTGQTHLSSKNKPELKLVSNSNGSSTYQMVGSGEVVVEISPKDTCWVQIQDENKKVLKDDTLKKDYKPIVYKHAEETSSDLVLILGAPENVTLKLNGQAVKATKKVVISKK